MPKGTLGERRCCAPERGFLHDVSPLDPVTFAAVAGALVAVACAAAVVPAVRAARMDPARALRTD